MVRSSRYRIRNKLEFEDNNEEVVQPTLPMPPMERLQIKGGNAVIESNKIMKMPKFKNKLDVHANKNNIKLIL